MEAKDLLLNDSAEREVVKQIRKVLPNIGIAIFSKTLVIKTIYLSDLAALVVAS